jgi:hypothetical protein
MVWCTVLVGIIAMYKVLLTLASLCLMLKHDTYELTVKRNGRTQRVPNNMLYSICTF